MGLPLLFWSLGYNIPRLRRQTANRQENFCFPVVGIITTMEQERRFPHAQC